ncbi:MAG: helicase-related protein [Butyricicoccus sp.]|nr:helicase-related protein [Butyricicoccus sp.]
MCKAIDKVPRDGRIIIYCTRICDVEDMLEYLVGECEISPAETTICHSKLHDRQSQEERFLSGEARIMVATSAFGMGVHIPNIRLVIVSQLPFSILAFYQMAGRAGRDGEKAKALLLYNGNDYQTNLDIISAKDEYAVQAVDALYALCQSDDDLHTQVIDYLLGKAGV